MSDGLCVPVLSVCNEAAVLEAPLRSESEAALRPGSLVRGIALAYQPPAPGAR